MVSELSNEKSIHAILIFWFEGVDKVASTNL